MIFIRRTVSLILALLFITGTNSFSQESKSNERIISILERLQSYKTFNDAVIDIRQRSPEIGAKLENYLRSKKLLDKTVPSLKLVNGSIVAGNKDEMRLTILENQTFQIFWGKNQKTFTKQTTFEDLVHGIEEMSQVISYSPFDLFISSAHANILIPIGGAVASMYVIGGIGLLIDWALNGRDEPGAQRALETLQLVCSRADSLPVEELVEGYNKIAREIERHCPEVFDHRDRNVCRGLASTRGCIQEKLERARVTNNGERESGKPIVEFIPRERRYRVQRATRQ